MIWLLKLATSYDYNVKDKTYKMVKNRIIACSQLFTNVSYLGPNFGWAKVAIQQDTGFDKHGVCTNSNIQMGICVLFVYQSFHNCLMIHHLIV